MGRKKSKVRIRKDKEQRAKKESKIELAETRLGVHYMIYDFNHEWVHDVIQRGKDTLVIQTKQELPKEGPLSPPSVFDDFIVLIEPYKEQVMESDKDDKINDR